MRTLNIIAALVFSSGLFWACSGDDDGPVITASDEAVITAPTSGSSYILREENAMEQADRFVWSKANFNVPTQINYRLQADLPGNDFQSPAILGETTATQLAVSVEHLNNTAAALGLTPNEAAVVELRVVASVNNNFDKLVSEAINISISPYSNEAPGPSYLWVPGSYQATSGYGGDWSPAEAPQLRSSASSATMFEGYVYFAADTEYKFTAAPEWGNGEYGDGGSGTLLLNDGPNLSAQAGYYRINADTEALTYSLLKTDWGIIGDATPGLWETGTDMVYIPEDKAWTITLDLQPGEVKFRANDDWALNLGDDDADGSLEQDGANIVITEAGNYTIELNLSNPGEYTYAITVN